MSSFWEDFENEYSNLASDVLDANNVTYEQRLRDFIRHVDSFGWAKELTASLAPNFDYSKSYDANATGDGGTFDWSEDRKVRLGEHLSMFRYFAEHKDAYFHFSTEFMFVGTHLDDMVATINRQLFEPFARDLSKLLRKHQARDTISNAVPGSDRIVSVDHNSPSYVELKANLNVIETAITTSNVLGAEDPDERDRIVAELGAAKRLLEAIRVRVNALKELLLPVLSWISGKVADHVVGLAITAASTILATIFGW